ncbi:unnamed protein product [Closterium sp. NIES-64]|nr:unnamed protein product [Closterium sp. NIES-64]
MAMLLSRLKSTVPTPMAMLMSSRIPLFCESLQLLGCVRTPEAACDLLVRPGALPLHFHSFITSLFPALSAQAACDLLVRPGALPLHFHSFITSLFPALSARSSRIPLLFSALSPSPCNSSASLQLLGCVRTPEAACDLLVRAGALPLHSHSFRLAASAMPATFPASVADYSANLAANPPPDPDQGIRVDLTHLKVYTIDSYDTVEVDDGLSAETLPDGRIKVWIHVADPSRWMRLGDRLDTEARKRATSAYFATGAVPMIPFSLAAGPMSLSLPPAPAAAPAAAAADAAGANGGAATGDSASAVVCAVTVVVTLNPDFSIDDVDIMNSFICPTYRLAYDQLPEMLAMAGEHEPELLLLSDVAAGRLRYRMQNGAANISIPESDIKVFSATSHCPEISVSTIDQSDPSRRLVSEAMVLCGEAVARFGAERDLPLPYRGQGPPDRMTDEDEEDMQALPEGPCRAVHLRSFMSRSEIKCSGPIPHAGLGLQGYVQFSSPIRRYSDLLAHYQGYVQVSSPIRRYSDLLAHYQVKALLRDLDTIVSHCAARQREVRRAEGAVERYWLQEFLRRLLTLSHTDTDCCLSHRVLLPDRLPRRLPYYLPFCLPDCSQVKALLRGEPPPLSVSDLDTIVSHCAARQREVRRAEGAVERYWLQEYLRRLPANTVLTAVMLKWLRADGSPLALMLVEEVRLGGLGGVRVDGWRSERGQKATLTKMQRDVRVGDSVDVIIAEADSFFFSMFILCVFFPQVGMKTVMKLQRDVRVGDSVDVILAEADFPFFSMFILCLFVPQVGMETVMKMQRDVRVGDSVDVIIAEADPARDKLRLVEAPPSFREAQMRGLAYGEGEEGGLEDGGEEDRREEGELEAGEGESSGEAWEGSVDVEIQPLAKL